VTLSPLVLLAGLLREVYLVLVSCSTRLLVEGNRWPAFPILGSSSTSDRGTVPAIHPCSIHRILLTCLLGPKAAGSHAAFAPPTRAFWKLPRSETCHVSFRRSLGTASRISPRGGVKSTDTPFPWHPNRRCLPIRIPPWDLDRRCSISPSSPDDTSPFPPGKGGIPPSHFPPVPSPFRPSAVPPPGRI